MKPALHFGTPVRGRSIRSTSDGAQKRGRLMKPLVGAAPRPVAVLASKAVRMLVVMVLTGFAAGAWAQCAALQAVVAKQRDNLMRLLPCLTDPKCPTRQPFAESLACARGAAQSGTLAGRHRDA